MDSKNFKIDILEPKQTKNNLIIKKTMRIQRKKGDITYADIEHFYKQMTDIKKIDPHKISISGMLEKYYTLKSKDEANLKPWDDDDYYQDRAEDFQKFNAFKYIDIVVWNF